jgi:hypothetical protein
MVPSPGTGAPDRSGKSLVVGRRGGREVRSFDWGAKWATVSAEVGRPRRAGSSFFFFFILITLLYDGGVALALWLPATWPMAVTVM